MDENLLCVVSEKRGRQERGCELQARERLHIHAGFAEKRACLSPRASCGLSTPLTQLTDHDHCVGSEVGSPSRNPPFRNLVDPSPIPIHSTTTRLPLA